MKENGLDKELETRIFAAELRTYMPSIDFHGHYPDDLSARLDQFIYAHKEESSLKIIHGHGKGILKKRVLDMCAVHPLVDAVIEKSGYVIILL